MRIFIAGASGVIGVRLVSLLVADGHEVAGMTRTPQKAPMLGSLGARPVICDVFDPEKLRAVVGAFGPDLVLHQLTDLPDDAAGIRQHAAANARIRTEGTRNLLAAALAAGASRVLAQSIAWTPPAAGAAAVAELEGAVLAVGGVVLRYGQFYGPGTYFETELPPPPRIGIDEAAARTLLALEAPSGVITVLDDDVLPA